MPQFRLSARVGRALFSSARRVVLTAACLAATPAFATDHFLTIGGGDSPSHNQVSLEKNVVYLQHVLDDIGAGQSHHDIYFSDGNDPGRDLQAHVANEIPKVNTLLARVLFNNEDAIGIEYRNQQIEHVRGPSNRKSLAEWFDGEGKKLADGDRLIIYFTGHGGGGSKNQPRNTNMTMWRENAMPVKEFAGLLDKLPAKVQVVLVMVQCHAGGFADVIFKNADAGNNLAGLNDRPRCGFFATVPERPAAGCTSDINEENYHEYSTYFWEAISGKTRMGSTVKKPDFDGDGKISFAEAHAYVKLTSSTIDIPISTTDVFLRAFSRTSGAAPSGHSISATRPTTQPTDAPADSPRRQRRNRGGDGQINSPDASSKPDSAAAPDGTTDKPQKLLTVDSPYFALAESADPARKAVLDGLSEQLKLEGPERARAARDLANQMQRERDNFAGQKQSAFQAYNAAREKVATAIRGRWPELTVPFHPRQAEILRTEADEVVKAIETNEAYKQVAAQGKLFETLSEKEFELDRKWVKTQRFLRTLEDVALAANLPKVASADVVERYKRLLAAEYGELDTQTQAAH